MMRHLPAACLSMVLALAGGCRQAEQAPMRPPPAEPSAAVPAAPASRDAAATSLEIPIRNARMLDDDVLTGGQPTVEQFERAAAAGFRTVVNLRAPGEEGSWDEATKAEELGLRYVAIPVAGTGGLTVDNARKLAEIYDDPDARPLMIHCASGNRVGALFALEAFHFDGESAEEALAIGREAGLTKLEETVRELLESGGE